MGEARAATPRWWHDAILAHRAAAPDATWLELRLPTVEAATWADGPLPPGVRIIADGALAPGDLILSGPAGRIDARAAAEVSAVVAGAR